MPTLELLHTRTFDAEMNRLRCECFPGQFPTGDAADQFDGWSTHVLARVDGRLAASLRLTPGPHAWFEFLSEGRADIPTGPDVADLSRAMVAPAFRGQGHGLFELVMVEGLLLAHDRGFRHVVGGMVPGRRFRPFLEQLGYAFPGPAVLVRGLGGVLLSLLFPRVKIAYQRTRWAAGKAALFHRLREVGYEWIDHGCPIDVALPTGSG
jgi:hypothetical protein